MDGTVVPGIVVSREGVAKFDNCIYNPQNEMLRLTKTKCIFSKNETSHDYSFYLIF